MIKNLKLVSFVLISFVLLGLMATTGNLNENLLTKNKNDTHLKIETVTSNYLFNDSLNFGYFYNNANALLLGLANITFSVSVNVMSKIFLSSYNETNYTLQYDIKPSIMYSNFTNQVTLANITFGIGEFYPNVTEQLNNGGSISYNEFYGSYSNFNINKSYLTSENFNLNRTSVFNCYNNEIPIYNLSIDATSLINATQVYDMNTDGSRGLYHLFSGNSILVDNYVYYQINPVQFDNYASTSITYSNAPTNSTNTGISTTTTTVTVTTSITKTKNLTSFSFLMIIILPIFILFKRRKINK